MHEESDRKYMSFQEEIEDLSDEEVEEAILDRVLDQGEVETENLYLQCQDGIVSVEGLLPSASQYQALMSLLRDELNLEHVVDRVRIQDEVVFGDDDDLNPRVLDEE
jgi:osmotically-inducible protein OsmY